MTLVVANNLIKSYGKHRALNGFDMTVEAGQIVGLIGLNGSGKTTALKSITGLCNIDEGTLSVLGCQPKAQRAQLMQRLSYIADSGTLPRWMRVNSLLRFVADVHPAFDLARAQAHLKKTDIDANVKIRALSKGMTVQLHLAIVLACNVDLLVLDEPTLGLDILYRQAFYDALLNDHFEATRSIIITTHEVAEVEHVLTDVVFIQHGRTVLASSMASLNERFCQLVAPASQQGAVEALGPLSLKKNLQGITAVFADTPRTALEKFGTVNTPSLPELFVATIGEDELAGVVQ